MFYLAYLKGELLRRRARTLLTVVGLALGVAIVIVVASLAKGLDQAQAKALDPLGSIGTDLSVTVQPDASGPFGFGSGRSVLTANQSALTDLSKLGKAGDHFSHDFFLPGTQLTFPAAQAAYVTKLDGVASAAAGLTLTAVHQEGVVPKIVSQIQTGGQIFRVDRRVRPSAAQQKKIEACLAKARASGGSSTPAPTATTPGPFGRIAGGAIGRFGDFAKCFPESRIRFTFRTPKETLRQVVDPPQTNIQSSTYVIAGVDQTQPKLALVTPAQVRKGRYLAAAGGKEALVGTAYARRQKLKLGSRLLLNGTAFTVVGLVDPPLGGQSADVYLPLARLQALAKQKGLANVVLVRAKDAGSVAAVQKDIERRFGGAQVASAKDVASSVSGSLVDASNLSHTLGAALAIVAAVAAFLLAAVLALASVAKRTRELGTLRALGWSKRLVVRQIVGESLAQGVAGGLLGVALGVFVALTFDAFAPTLTAQATAGGSETIGLAARTVSRGVSLDAPLTLSILLLGLVLAVAGGLLAGAAGALRAARLRPADALRTVE